jgi:hypothetical protein
MIRVAVCMKKSVIIAIIAAAVIVPGAVYAVSPYFTETMIDEPAPVVTSGQGKIPQDSLEIEEAMMECQDTVMGDAMVKELRGEFQSAGDGIHNASGKATALYLEDGSVVLRFENFRVTNGPDLYVYLATDRGASDYVDLGRLKANSGNQNYEVPAGIDLSKYDNVIIWCKAFSVYFGGAELVFA